MEQKQSKQRNMKTLVTKSEPATEKMVLKAESIVEVSKTKGVKAPIQNTAAPAPAPTQTAAAQTAKASKAKKTETQAQVQPAQVQQAQVQQAPAKLTKATKSVEAQSVQPVAVQPTQTAGQAKGKRVAQTLATAATAATAATTATTAPTAATVTATAPTKTSKATKKVVSKTTPTLVQKAGAKTAKKATLTEKVVKVAKKLQKVNVEEAQEEKQMDDKLRYFKLYYNDNICGRYSGKKPKQAANKAFSSIIKDMKKTDNKEGVNIDITFTIKECTRNSFHKEYKYIGKRLLLKSPVKVTIENGDGTSKDIVYKYHNDLKKAPKI